MSDSKEELFEIKEGIEKELENLGLSPKINGAGSGVVASSEGLGEDGSGGDASDEEELNEEELSELEDLSSALTDELEKSLENEFKNVPSSDVQNLIADELELALNKGMEGQESSEADSSPDDGVVQNSSEEIESDINSNKSSDNDNNEGSESLIEDSGEELAEKEDLANEVQSSAVESANDQSNSPSSAEETSAFNEDELKEIMDEMEDIEQESAVPGPVKKAEPTRPNNMELNKFQGIAGGKSRITASGELELDLSIMLQGKEAKIILDKNNGFKLKIGKIEMKLDNDGSLVFLLPGGVKFTLPLTSEEEIINKKVAS
jgi:hypothetical protein